jgi:hypothetical protein
MSYAKPFSHPLDEAKIPHKCHPITRSKIDNRQSSIESHEMPSARWPQRVLCAKQIIDYSKAPLIYD